ncbi:hypothetical protein [Listeria booriae]|uniref:Uncharacterized protein n=1 Tax=Listeria booriae TaxID=1552123 RepID=A0A841ZYK2_9LIST|nr:hypothetical protein [Listeria booriae]MBC1565072.1 hypothetical protein [Listeria booriae]
MSEDTEARLRKLALELAHIQYEDGLTAKQQGYIEIARESIEDAYTQKNN